MEYAAQTTCTMRNTYMYSAYLSYSTQCLHHTIQYNTRCYTIHKASMASLALPCTAMRSRRLDYDVPCMRSQLIGGRVRGMRSFRRVDCTTCCRCFATLEKGTHGTGITGRGASGRDNHDDRSRFLDQYNSMLIFCISCVEYIGRQS